MAHNLQALLCRLHLFFPHCVVFSYSPPAFPPSPVSKMEKKGEEENVKSDILRGKKKLLYVPPTYSIYTPEWLLAESLRLHL